MPGTFFDVDLAGVVWARSRSVGVISPKYYCIDRVACSCPLLPRLDEQDVPSQTQVSKLRCLGSRSKKKRQKNKKKQMMASFRVRWLGGWGILPKLLKERRVARIETLPPLAWFEREGIRQGKNKGKTRRGARSEGATSGDWSE